jgi:hypothetical protein
VRAALRALAAIQSPKLADAVKIALGDKDKALLEAARQLAGKASPALAVEVNAAVLGKGGIREQQEALATIGAQPIRRPIACLPINSTCLSRASCPHPSARSARSRGVAQDGAIKQKLTAYEALGAGRRFAGEVARVHGRRRREGRPRDLRRESRGRLQTAVTRSRAKAATSARTSPGPREARPATLLQSIVEPSAAITPGYENVLMTLNERRDGRGLLSAEDANESHARLPCRRQEAEAEEG